MEAASLNMAKSMFCFFEVEEKTMSKNNTVHLLDDDDDDQTRVLPQVQFP